MDNKIYLDCEPELMRTIIKTLTYKIKKNIPGATHFSQFEIIKKRMSYYSRTKSLIR